MGAESKLPAELRKVIDGFTFEARSKVLDLHSKYAFSDDQLDCFLTIRNERVMTPTLVLAFEAFLEQEMANSGPKKQSSPSGKTSSASKRRKTVMVPGSLTAFMGKPGSAPSGVGSAPAPLRDAMVAAAAAVAPLAPAMGGGFAGSVAAAEAGSAKLAGTPATSNPLQVSLKSSVNGDLPGAGGAETLPGGAGGPIPEVYIDVMGDHDLWKGKRHGAYEWMNEAVEDRAFCLDARLAAMEGAVTSAMCERHAGGDGEAVVGIVGVPAQAEVVLCGRIACEGLDGKLNERSILLEGSRASVGGVAVHLNVADCASVAAFPGQIVGVIGRSGGMRGDIFHARDFLAGLPIPRSITPRDVSSRRERPLHIMAAAGPYCLRDGLDYTPLEKVFEHAARQRPDVLVLFGPFLDASNKRVVAGDPVLASDPEPCSFEAIYRTVLLKKLRAGILPLRRGGDGVKTQVLIVPSLEETLCFHPMPQPPLNASLVLETEEGRRMLDGLQQLGVRFLPNPAHLQLGELRVSLTSADALSPLLREVVLRGEGRKIEECLRQLLGQRTLFPVLPRDPPQVSEARAAAFDFPEGELPDICVFPSQCGGLTGAFVEGSAFVNPGNVCRPAMLGTFAEMWFAPAAEGSGDPPPISKRLRVDTLKLS